jgi:hypothetical protein
MVCGIAPGHTVPRLFRKTELTRPAQLQNTVTSKATVCTNLVCDVCDLRWKITHVRERLACCAWERKLRQNLGKELWRIRVILPIPITYSNYLFQERKGSRINTS